MVVENPIQAGEAAGPERLYFQFLENGEWKIQFCTHCRRAVFYPRVACPHCGEDALEWLAPQGAGTVYSSSTIYRSPEQGGSYNVSLIDIDEGVRLMGCVQGCLPSEVKIGQRVRARIEKREGGARLVFDRMEAMPCA